jgi:hypothetical protein
MPTEFKLAVSACLLLIAAGLLFPQERHKEKSVPFVDANAWQVKR